MESGRVIFYLTCSYKKFSSFAHLFSPLDEGERTFPVRSSKIPGVWLTIELQPLVSFTHTA